HNYPRPEPLWYETKEQSGFDYGTCGKVTLSKRKGSETRQQDSITSFRIASVNYDQIASAAHAAAQAEIKTVQREVASLVRSVFDSRYVVISRENMAYAQRQLQAIEANSRARLNNNIVQAVGDDGSAIDNDVRRMIKEKGWMALGSYFSVFAETSSALADAQRAFQIDYVLADDAQRILAGNDLKLDKVGLMLSRYAATVERQDSSTSRNLLKIGRAS